MNLLFSDYATVSGRGSFHAAPILAIKSRISSTRHAVVRSLSFIGFGYFPDLTPLSHVVRPTGISAGIGGFASWSPITCHILK